MKYLVQIEFRYNDKNPMKDDYHYVNKMLTVGIYDTPEEAYEKGNKVLEKLEFNFDRHKFPQGHYAPKERFSKNGGAFGSEKNLITNMAYLKTPFQFFAKITKLHFLDLEETTKEAVEGCKRYRDFKNREEC